MLIIIITFLSINIVSFKLYWYPPYIYNYLFYIFSIINIINYLIYFVYIRFTLPWDTYLNPINFINNFLKLYGLGKVPRLFIFLFYILLTIFIIFVASTFITGFDLTEGLPFYWILEPIVFYTFIIFPFLLPVYWYLKIKIYKMILNKHKDNPTMNFFVFIDSIMLLFLFIIIYRIYLFLLFLK
jgi:hypothetical protein